MQPIFTHTVLWHFRSYAIYLTLNKHKTISIGPEKAKIMVRTTWGISWVLKASLIRGCGFDITQILSVECVGITVWDHVGKCMNLSTDFTQLTGTAQRWRRRRGRRIRRTATRDNPRNKQIFQKNSFIWIQLWVSYYMAWNSIHYYAKIYILSTGKNTNRHSAKYEKLKYNSICKIPPTEITTDWQFLIRSCCSVA